jgi:hypothetical protein
MTGTIAKMPARTGAQMTKRGSEETLTVALAGAEATRNGPCSRGSTRTNGATPQPR